AVRGDALGQLPDGLVLPGGLAVLEQPDAAVHLRPHRGAGEADDPRLRDRYRGAELPVGEGQDLLAAVGEQDRLALAQRPDAARDAAGLLRDLAVGDRVGLLD